MHCFASRGSLIQPPPILKTLRHLLQKDIRRIIFKICLVFDVLNIFWHVVITPSLDGVDSSRFTGLFETFFGWTEIEKTEGL